MTNLPESISPDQVSQILQRAAEIDASGESLTVTELKRIMDEAGIARAAAEAAIQEILEAEDPPGRSLPVLRRSKDTLLLSMGLGGAVGVVLGLLSRLGTDWAFPVAGAMAIYSLFQSVRGMKRKTQLEFQLQNLVSWFALFVSAAAGLGSSIDDVFSVLGPIWLVTSFIGGMLVRYGPAESEPDDTEMLENPET